MQIDGIVFNALVAFNARVPLGLKMREAAKNLQNSRENHLKAFCNISKLL